MRLPMRMGFLVAVFLAMAVGPADAQLGDLFSAPKTLIDRAIEARSTSDIVKDNRIVAEVNAIMAELGTIKASTEIYEQRLLVTGLFDDKAVYDAFERKVRGVDGVKKLHWHVVYMSEADQEKSTKLLDWADSLALTTKANARLIGDLDVSDVNFRIAGDSFGVLYLLGRARSDEELKAAVAATRDGNGVRDVKNYAYMKP